MPIDEMEDLDSPLMLDDDEDDLDDIDVSEAVKPIETTKSARLAAILLYGGKHGGDARDIQETYDFWALTTDIHAIAHAPVHKLVIADTEEEIEERLASRYEAPEGFTMLHREEREVRQSREETKSWRGSHRFEYKKLNADGWRVLTTPMLMDSVNSENHLLSLCIQHRQFIIDASSVQSLGGAKHLEARSYIVSGAGSEGIHRIRWNPLLWQQREHRARKATAENRLRDTLPNHLLNDLGNSLNPSNWPNGHPLYGMFDGIKGAQRGGGWHSVWREQPEYGIHKIIAYIRANLRLTPHLRPWRAYQTSRHGRQENRTYRQILQDALDHVHGIRRNKSKEYRFLTRWLLAEAKAVGLAMPLPPQMPREGKTRKVRQCPTNEVQNPVREAA